MEPGTTQNIQSIFNKTEGVNTVLNLPEWDQCIADIIDTAVKDAVSEDTDLQ